MSAAGGADCRSVAELLIGGAAHVHIQQSAVGLRYYWSRLAVPSNNGCSLLAADIMYKYDILGCKEQF